MTDTANLSLPLVQPAQAQKHVTVNEALARLDGLAQLTLVSVSETVPPVGAEDGTAFGVPPGAVNDWAGQARHVALRIGGGWVYVPARRGWRALILDAGERAVFDGEVWRPGALSLSSGGAGMAVRVREADIEIGPGGAVTTSLAFPARSIVFGATGRVLTAMTGTATAWDLGDTGDPTRYATGLVPDANAWVNGPSAPFVTWSELPLVLTPVGGTFSAGAVRLALHFAELSAPAST